MAAFLPTDYAFLGQAWTLFPAHNTRGGLNVVARERLISHQFISLCLTRKGEDLVHPDRGLAPDLFEPLSNPDPDYVVYHLEREALIWIQGIQRLKVHVSGYNAVQNKLAIEAYFVPLDSPNQNLLTFPYYLYQGARIEGDVATFLSSIQLNGQLFSLV